MTWAAGLGHALEHQLIANGFIAEGVRAPDTATAYEHPCQLYAYHAPAVVRTQGHHRHPQYLQIRLWGKVLDNELMWLCGSCHDAVHEWLGYLLAESRRPAPEPGRNAKAEAQRTADWYKALSAP